jgi:S-formylglutathione hydrolase FrmB
LFAITISTFGQGSPVDARPTFAFQTEQIVSKLMGRSLLYRVILPKSYKFQPTKYYPVIYLLHGLTGHYTNWIDKAKLTEHGVQHEFIIITPEGDNGWYTDSVSKPNDKYESYIVKELIPEIDKKFRTVSDRERRFIAGLSMGGYGAIKFGLKYPDMFSLVGSFSGALGVAAYSSKNPDPISMSLASVFGDLDSETRKNNDIFKMIREVTPDKLKSMPFIYQSCGTEDFLVQNNREFLALLNEKKVPHEYREHPGGHNWVFWDDQVREFLDVAERRLKK